MDRLTNKVAIVTGATSGIGLVTAKLFAAEGAGVVLCGRRQNVGQRIADEISGSGGKAFFVTCDVTDEDSVRNLVDRTVETFGGLDILYNNAGGSTSRDGSVEKAPLDEFWRAIKLDLFGTWLCSRHAIPEMRKRGGGSIINSGSIVGVMGVKNRAAYTASKGGVMALTRNMAIEFAPDKIRVNSVVPGVVLTERIQKFVDTEPAVAKHLNDYPMGPATPEDVAEAVLYFASDESRRITGHALPIEGGMLIA